MPEPIIIESLTLVTLLLYAIDRVKIQPICDRDPYESRRQELKGARLVKVLIFYQLIKRPDATRLVTSPASIARCPSGARRDAQAQHLFACSRANLPRSGDRGVGT